MLLETVQLALTGRNIKWLLKRPENNFKSNQICFYSNLSKVFQSPEFQAKFFLSEFEWVDLRETASFKNNPQFSKLRALRKKFEG